mmetsp:Transcript_22222/g.50904  ORF Transcript_22222/g.50904 Transcript_22222/m.50904 type:complete len:142 (+) Transcript_22222:4-429(+)
MFGMSAYIIFSCGAGMQTRAGFDGWILLLRHEVSFDTEDQAWPRERERLNSIAEQKVCALKAAGVDVEALELKHTTHLLLEAPECDIEDERMWCIEFFPHKMYDYVADDKQLVQRLTQLQADIFGTGPVLGSTNGSLTVQR